MLAGARRLCVREEFLVLCGGDASAALVLTAAETLTQGGALSSVPTTATELSDASLGLVCPRTVRYKLPLLMQWGYVSMRGGQGSRKALTLEAAAIARRLAEPGTLAALRKHQEQHPTSAPLPMLREIDYATSANAQAGTSAVLPTSGNASYATSADLPGFTSAVLPMQREPDYATSAMAPKFGRMVNGVGDARGLIESIEGLSVVSNLSSIEDGTPDDCSPEKAKTRTLKTGGVPIQQFPAEHLELVRKAVILAMQRRGVYRESKRYGEGDVDLGLCADILRAGDLAAVLSRIHEISLDGHKGTIDTPAYVRQGVWMYLRKDPFGWKAPRKSPTAAVAGAQDLQNGVAELAQARRMR